jgi:23S rRNA G2069 N7-methylase RlmK/C1962 C5-methylase RlmI
MRARRLTPRRYQLDKVATASVRRGHPWIYRSLISSAAKGFRDGQWLKLVDGANEIAGYGIFEKDGLIAIRTLKRGSRVPDPAFVRERVRQALAKREALRRYTDAFRAIHGENDGLPAVVFDVFGSFGVLQTYSVGADVLGRFVATELRRELGLRGVLWKPPAKRKGGRGDAKPRVLFGRVPERVQWREGQLRLEASLHQGQKSGAFLDLRALRKWIAARRWNGSRVLNLFAYTGTLGLAAEIGGAGQVVQVDIAESALEFAKRRHTLDASKHRFVVADVFAWLKTLSPSQQFDLVIVDPPQVASQTSQVGKALANYATLYELAQRHVAPGGFLVAACCTGRIPRRKFEALVEGTLGREFRRVADLAPEDDHPVAFPEGDYLKILIFQRRPKHSR